jgi:hypothetical protein
VVAALAVLAGSVAIGLVATAGAERAVTLGKTKRTPRPSCPKDPCLVMGHVTGFQRSAAGKNGLFRPDEPGKIVAWSVDLSKPNKEQRNIFGEAGGTERYGKGPTAGIGILRKKSRGRYELMRRSPIMKMREYYGDQPVITLEKPLRVRAGDIVAVTTATWLPNFAGGLSKRDVWVASRKPDECNAPDIETFFEQSHAHLKEGSTRRYGCTYNKARLLYWAYFVPKRGR